MFPGGLKVNTNFCVTFTIILKLKLKVLLYPICVTESIYFKIWK